MTLRRIVTLPDPVLKRKAHPVNKFDKTLHTLLDDMVDTAGTLCQAARALKEHGATRVAAYATHAVLSGNAIKNIEGSVLDEVVVTDTIPLSVEAGTCKRVRQLSVGGLLAESIRRINQEESVSTLFMD